MANYAEIVGGEVRFYNRNLVDSKPLSELVKQYASEEHNNWRSPILPPGTIAVSSSHGFSMFAIERPPRRTHIIGAHDLGEFMTEVEDHVRDGDKTIVQNLPVPWEYYIISVSDRAHPLGFGGEAHAFGALSVFWSRKKLDSTSELELYTANLPNISSNGLVCLGATAPVNNDPQAKVTEMIDGFYDSVFNTDLGSQSGPAPSWYDWGKLREHEGDAIDKMGFPQDPVGASLEQIMQSQGFAPIPQAQEAFASILGTPRYIIENLRKIHGDAVADRLLAALALNEESDSAAAE